MRPERSDAGKIRASIIGVTGYTGLELLRLLLAHPRIEIGALSARQQDDTPIGTLYPHLAHLDLQLSDADPATLARQSDIVFICLPHKAAQDVVAALHGTVKLIDLSADYRLDDAATYERYYETHRHPALLREVVYGAPEIIGRGAIASAHSVANPGCFALLAQLMLFPLRGFIQHADLFAVTGSSGAGKSPGDGTHHPVRSHNIKSYSINAHRHIPEILRGAGLQEAQLNFVPASGPFVRGIFAQAFITPAGKIDAQAAFASAYGKHPFIRLQDSVELAHVTGSNFCDLSVRAGQDGRILVQGALDNLVKGAAGCAVQNMNLMLGWDETLGLANLAPVYP